jgi:dCTP deaminase
MILKSDAIASLIEESKKPNAEDPFVIAPEPNLEKLRNSGSASVDLRLGTWFLTLRQARMPCFHILEKKTGHSQFTKTHYVPFGTEYYLHPQNFVLGVTLEWIRIPSDMAAYVVGKSTLGRRGLIIATATGVHPGFTGCLTLELTNVGEIPISIKPGMPICQLFMHKVDTNQRSKVDISQHIGLRRPRLGEFDSDDEITNKLCNISK